MSEHKGPTELFKKEEIHKVEGFKVDVSGRVDFNVLTDCDVCVQLISFHALAFELLPSVILSWKWKNKMTFGICYIFKN